MYSSYASSVISGGYVFNNLGAGIADTTVLSNKTISQNFDQPVLVNYLSEALLRMIGGDQYSLTINGVQNYPSVPFAAPLVDSKYSFSG